MITDKQIKALSKYGWTYTPGILRRNDDENIVILDFSHIQEIAVECMEHKKAADDKKNKESIAIAEKRKKQILLGVIVFIVIVTFSVFL